MPRLSSTETRIIRSLLITEFGPSASLLDKIASVEFETRHLTGTGYYVSFANTNRLPRLDKVNIELSDDLRTVFEPPADLIGFTLFIRDGYLSSFEAYTYGDVKWPVAPMEQWILFEDSEDGVPGIPKRNVGDPRESSEPSLADTVRRKLEARLSEELRQECDEARKIGYNPSYFLAMLSRYGPVEACRRVVVADKIPDGFARLLELNRLELTAEATVLRDPWRRLFSETVLDRARKRLVAFGRSDLAIGSAAADPT